MLARKGGQVCVCDLEAAVPVKQPTVSHHLRLLREAGFVDSEKQRPWAYYYVHRDQLDALRTRIERGLTQRRARTSPLARAGGGSRGREPALRDGWIAARLRRRPRRAAPPVHRVRRVHTAERTPDAVLAWLDAADAVSHPFLVAELDVDGVPPFLGWVRASGYRPRACDRGIAEFSVALCARHGFREVGTYEKHAQLDGVWRDVLIVECLIPETLT